MKMYYSLFKLEKEVHKPSEFGGYIRTKKGMEYVDTFDTLEEAKEKQKKYKQKTIILQSF